MARTESRCGRSRQGYCTVRKGIDSKALRLMHVVRSGVPAIRAKSVCINGHPQPYDAAEAEFGFEEKWAERLA